MRRIETNEWWQDLVQLKDDLSLRELAEKFKVTPGAISAAFKREGITRRPAPPGPRARRKSRIPDELPPEPGEASASTEQRPGSKDALIEPYRHLLGQVRDKEVAEKAGVAVKTISNYRRQRGIKGYSGPRNTKGGGRKSKIDAFAHLLGVEHDRVVAMKAGVTVNAVRNYRTKRGIGAVTGRPAATEPAVVTVQAVPTNGATNGVHSAAWLVVVGNGEARKQRVVVAGSISDAARQAEAAGLGHVVSLEYVADLV